MSELIRQLNKLTADEFIDDEGEAYRAKLLPGLNAEELAALVTQMPIATLPPEVTELLCYSKGLLFGWLEEIRFDAFSDFGRRGLFPACIELAHDGTGNYWVLDINKAGEWGAVFYVCHDPAVIIRQANNLLDFLGQVQEYGRFKSTSWFDEVYERLSFKIWKERKTHTGLVEATTAVASSDDVLSVFAAQQLPEFLFGDLRAKSVTQGFAYDRFLQGEQIRKHELEPLWALVPLRKSWISKLFGW